MVIAAAIHRADNIEVEAGGDGAGHKERKLSGPSEEETGLGAFRDQEVGCRSKAKVSLTQEKEAGAFSI